MPGTSPNRRCGASRRQGPVAGPVARCATTPARAGRLPQIPRRGSKRSLRARQKRRKGAGSGGGRTATRPTPSRRHSDGGSSRSACAPAASWTRMPARWCSAYPQRGPFRRRRRDRRSSQRRRARVHVETHAVRPLGEAFVLPCARSQLLAEFVPFVGLGDFPILAQARTRPPPERRAHADTGAGGGFEPCCRGGLRHAGRSSPRTPARRILCRAAQ